MVICSISVKKHHLVHSQRVCHLPLTLEPRQNIAVHCMVYLAVSRSPIAHLMHCHRFCKPVRLIEPSPPIRAVIEKAAPGMDHLLTSSRLLRCRPGAHQGSALDSKCHCSASETMTSSDDYTIFWQPWLFWPAALHILKLP